MRYIFICLLLCLSVATHISAEPVVKIGQDAPNFTLKDQNGTTHTLAQYKGKIVVLEWTNPTCPFVVRHYKAKTMTTLAGKHADVVWLTINSSHYTTDKDNAAWAKAENVKFVLNDSTGKVGKQYGARTTPHMYVVDAKGKLAYMGAIDDDPYGDKKESTNYVAKALESLKANQAVQTATTKEYGCSVKYKK